MTYKPITAVWEVTMGCNMRCGHCGSSCAEPLPDELTTEEAFDLCDQIAKLGLKWITLSGGEPLTRMDLPLIVKQLSDRAIAVNIITNGWMLGPDMAERLKQSGISTVAISIDGTQSVHDSIRKVGAFEHAKIAFRNLKSQGIKTGAVTTITKQNISILEELKNELVHIGVDSWQVQLGLPMGNLKEKTDWVLDPKQVNEIIDFCYRTSLEGKIKIFPADCIGYYTYEEQEIKKISYGQADVPVWNGCNAGIRGFGILQNGNILGCTSIRNEEFIEGNIRERPLKDIWEDDACFQWRREMKKSDLSGKCSICVYASKCLGGCPNTRLTINGDIHSENPYCAYYWQLRHLEEQYNHITDAAGLLHMGQTLLAQEKYQEASFVFMKVTNLDPNNKEAHKLKGYCEYMCGNYEQCKRDNETALKLGDREGGLADMKKASKMDSYRDMDLVEEFENMLKSLNNRGGF